MSGAGTGRVNPTLTISKDNVDMATSKMSARFVIATTLAVVCGFAHGAVELPRVTAVQARLFMQYTGELSKPLSASDQLWNVIAGGGGLGPSREMLVDVAVTGTSNTFGRDQVVDLVVKSRSTGKVLQRRKGMLGIFGPSGVTHVGFWLSPIGCESLVITASIAKSSKELTLPFQCGE